MTDMTVGVVFYSPCLCVAQFEKKWMESKMKETFLMKLFSKRS